VGPIIKAEYSEGVVLCKDTTRTTPWHALQLANLQEKYGRKPGETETEYLWLACLSSGD